MPARLSGSEAETRIAFNKGFSDRERDILRSLGEGHPNKVIARQLDITEATVKVNLKAVMRKINAANRSEAAIWAVRQGAVTAPFEADLAIDAPEIDETGKSYQD